jgi:hypothetical protein
LFVFPRAFRFAVYGRIDLAQAAIMAVGAMKADPKPTVEIAALIA